MVKKIWSGALFFLLGGVVFATSPVRAFTPVLSPVFMPTNPYEEDPPIFPTTIENYLKEDANACWFCKVFESVYDAINQMVTNLFNTLASSFLSLMGIGILFFLLFKVGKMLVQLQDVDLMQFLNDLFKPLGRAIIATALLGVTVAAGNQTIFYLITQPFMETSLRVSEEILTDTLSHVETLTAASKGKTRSNITNVDWSEINSEFEKENSKAPKTALGEANKKLMKEWMQKVSSSFVVGMAMGWTFMKIGISWGNFFSKGLPVAIAGFTLWAGFWLIYIFFPIRLLNAFVRIAFVLALMPLWIILWVFPVTQQYTKKAWEMFLSSCLLFIVLSVMVALALMLVDKIVPENLMNSETGDTKSRSDFFEMLIKGEDEEAKKYAGWGSGMILNCIAFTLLGWQLLEKAETLANSFIGGGGNIQLNVGNQTAATLAKEGQVAWSGAKMAGNVGLWAGGKVAGKVGSAVKRRFGGSGGGTQEGTGSSDGGGGGGTPPPRSNPTVLPGERGERGETGRTGDRGPQGPGSAGGTGSDNLPRPEGTNVREEITPPEVSQPTVSPVATENTRRATTTQTYAQSSSRTQTGSAAPATYGTNAASARETLAHLSPERQKAVRSLAAEGGRAPQLQKLSEDVAFVENSLGMKKADFDQAMKKHTWQTDAKKMQDFADSAFLCRDKPTSMEFATRRLLTDAGLSTGATRAESEQIAKRAGRAIEQRTPNTLSRDLAALGTQVFAAETLKRLPRS